MQSGEGWQRSTSNEAHGQNSGDFLQSTLPQTPSVFGLED